MIIVSQNKDEIINFNNIIDIKYADFTNISGGHEIYCHETKTEAIILGTYKTEQRAKEVLGEIADRYEHMKFLQVTQNHLIEYTNKPNFVYEMPIE